MLWGVVVLMKRFLSLLTLAIAGASATAAPIGVYTQWSAHALSGVSEASAVTYSRDTNSLYVVGDEGSPMVRYDKAGEYLDESAFIGPTERPDTEGLTYLGGGKFLLADERTQTGYVFTYVPNGTGWFGSEHVFGPPTGNSGLEGVAYDPATNSVWGVKEVSPMAVYQMIHFGLSGQTVLTNPGGMQPDGWGLADLADVYAMSASMAFAGTGQEMNLLFLSQASDRLIEVTRQGEVVSSLELGFLGSHNIEGVTMDDEGTLFLVAERTLAGGGPTLFVLNAVPEPSVFVPAGLGIACAFAFCRRKTVPG